MGDRNMFLYKQAWRWLVKTKIIYPILLTGIAIYFIYKEMKNISKKMDDIDWDEVTKDIK